MNAPQQRGTQRLIVISQKGYDVVPTVSLIFLTQIYNYIFSYTTIFIVFFLKKDSEDRNRAGIATKKSHLYKRSGHYI